MCCQLHGAELGQERTGLLCLLCWRAWGLCPAHVSSWPYPLGSHPSLGWGSPEQCGTLSSFSGPSPPDAGSSTPQSCDNQEHLQTLPAVLLGHNGFWLRTPQCFSVVPSPDQNRLGRLEPINGNESVNAQVLPYSRSGLTPGVVPGRSQAQVCKTFQVGRAWQ